MYEDAGRLIDAWESVRHGHYPGDQEDIDAVVLDCVDRLDRERAQRSPDADRVAFLTFGLVLMYGYLAWEPGPGVVDRAVAALLTTARAGGDDACGHPSHPADDDLEAQLEGFPSVLRLLADPHGAGKGAGADKWSDLDDWTDPYSGTPAVPDAECRWRCPRNIAAFALEAADAIRPGAAADARPT
ncbi:hypothetical protein ACWGJ2_21635 [Streptomyces sp. NPDC054796]